MAKKEGEGQELNVRIGRKKELEGEDHGSTCREEPVNDDLVAEPWAAWGP